MRATLGTLALGIALLLAGPAARAPAHAEVPVPPVARVTDLTGTLSGQAQQSLVQRLSDLETRKGSQIAVLVVRSTQPEAIEQYAIRVAEAWKLGRKGVDDGAILLVAMEDRAVRIETGYGLEGSLSDLVSKRIVDEAILPRFRQGDFAGGIDAGVDRMIRVVDGEPLPPPSSRPRGSGGAPGGLEGLLVVGFVLVVVVGGILRAILGRVPAATVVGGLAGGAAYILAGTVLAAAAVAVIAFLFTLGGMGGGRGRHGGWGSGGRGGGSWGGGGGSWSGGGGGFGGGGASGRW